MAIELASIFITKPIEWGIGKILDVLWHCACRERTTDHIGNVQYNMLECPNCHKQHHQFTNACERTIGREGRVAQIGIGFGNFQHVRDRGPLMGELLGWKCINVQAPVTYLCEGLGGEDLIEVNEVHDLKSGGLVHSDISYFTPKGNRALVNRWLTMPRNEMSEDRFVELFDNDALLAFDTRVENRFRDVLIKDRKLHQL
jgi:hypothetical protein